MSVLTLINSLIRKQFGTAVLMVFALVLSGCGAGGDSSDASAQIVDSTSGTGDETTNNGNEDPVEPTYVLNLISQPSDASIAQGNSYTFSVVVEHERPITVIWYLNGVSIQKTSSTSLVASTAGTYDCVIYDGTQSLGCDSFKLTVTTDAVQFVTITEQPSNQMVNEGVDVTLSVGATASGAMSYQWYFNGSAVSGATSANLVLDSVTVANDGDYYVVVNSAGVSTTSNTASLNVAASTSGSALISWNRPTQRDDSSDLSEADITSYEIYHATSSNGSVEQIDSVSGSKLSYTATGLEAGTHYFYLATVDNSGLRSKLSSAVSVEIN